MKSMRSFLAVTMFSLAAVWTGSALAAGPAHGGHGPHGKGARPELTAEQKAEHSKQRKELAAAVRSGDAAKVASLESQGKRGAPSDSERAERTKAKVQRLSELHAKLTPAQRAEWVAKWQKRDEKHGERGAKQGRGPMAQLKLSDAQLAQLKKARGSVDRSALRAKRAELVKSFAGTKFDAQAFVQAQGEERGAGRGRHLSELVKVLTPEQRVQLAERIEQGPAPRSK